MTPDHKILNKTEWHKAHRLIAAWKNDQQAAHACPRCEAAGIAIADHSVRPYAEWYELTCPKCDLVVMMHQPLSPPPATPVLSVGLSTA